LTFEVLAALMLKAHAFWNATVCELVNSYWCFGGV